MSIDVTDAAQWDNFDKIPSFSPVENIHMSLIAGKDLMMNLVTIEPGGIVPQHSHANEQAGYVISGTLILTLGDEVRHLTAGDCYVIPSNLPHSGATDANGCKVIDIFAPPRPDYVALQEAARADSSGKGVS